MLMAARTVIENGFFTVQSAFTTNFSGVTYNVSHARRHLLQMPLACITIDGLRECYLVEHVPGTNYAAFQELLQNVIKKSSAPNPTKS